MTAEPVITASAVSGVIIALLSIFNVGNVDAGAIETIVVAVLPVVLSVFARARVTPTV